MIKATTKLLRNIIVFLFVFVGLIAIEVRANEIPPKDDPVSCYVFHTLGQLNREVTLYYAGEAGLTSTLRKDNPQLYELGAAKGRVVGRAEMYPYGATPFNIVLAARALAEDFCTGEIKT